jgi:hypothetical protein
MFFVGGMSLPTMVGGKLELHAWNHVAATYDGAKLRIYINGAAPVESESSEPLACIPTVDFPADAPMTDEMAETFHTKGDVCIGGIKDKLAFDGKIDLCRLWDVVRTEDEIKANMNTTYSHPITQHLLGQWTFNEGSGETVVDSGGARNHGSFERYAGGVELRRGVGEGERGVALRGLADAGRRGDAHPGLNQAGVAAVRPGVPDEVRRGAAEQRDDPEAAHEDPRGEVPALHARGLPARCLCPRGGWSCGWFRWSAGESWPPRPPTAPRARRCCAGASARRWWACAMAAGRGRRRRAWRRVR